MKANKDVNGFQSAVKKISGKIENFRDETGIDNNTFVADHKTESGNISDLHTTIKSVSSELGDKVGELQKQDKIIRDLQTQQASFYCHYGVSSYGKPMYYYSGCFG